MMYVLAFLAALFVDSIPVFAPPAWIILTFLIIKYGLNPWAVLMLGAVKVFGFAAAQMRTTTPVAAKQPRHGLVEMAFCRPDIRERHRGAKSGPGLSIT